MGYIPEDAIRAGMTVEDGPTYVGQAYIKPCGIVPVTIYPNCKSGVAASFAKPVQADGHIKVSSVLSTDCIAAKID